MAKRAPTVRGDDLRPTGVRSWIFGAVMAAALVIVYAPSLNGGAIFDDHRLIFKNPHIVNPSGLWRLWSDPKAAPDYYPLTYTTWWIEQRLFGSAEWPRHVFNILLHAANAALLWTLLRALHVPGAMLAAAVFALHPVQAESVAWMSQRKSVLSGLFYLLSLREWLRAEGLLNQKASDGLQDSDDHANRRSRMLSLLYFALALLAKPVTMTLLGVLPVILWWRRGRVTVGSLGRLWPYAAIALPMAALTIWLQATHVRATGEGFALSAADRVVLSGRVAWFYLYSLVAPLDLSFAYPRWEVKGTDWRWWLWPAAVVIVLAGMWLLRNRIGRGALAAAAFFLITLSPALGFFNVYWHLYYYVADHVQYLACIGPIVALCGLGAWLVRRTAGRDSAAKLTMPWGIAGLVVVGACGVLTLRQAPLYADEPGMWRDVLQRHPNSTLALNNLGINLQDEALRLQQRGFANDGTAMLKDASLLFQRAIESDPREPDSYYNLAFTCQLQGDDERAVQLYLQGIDINPDYAEARVNLAGLLRKRGDTAGAEAQLQQVLRANPEHAAAHNVLGKIRLSQGDHAAARDEFLAATRSVDAYVEAWCGLGLAYEGLREWDRLIDAYARALELNPSLVEAHCNIGVGYAKAGRTEPAIKHWQEAARLDPQGPYGNAARNFLQQFGVPSPRP